ncbi:Uu.00g018490.m01.CDS01 [Anthostomella pinea]|uniref:Uu.00g018490.m01.CDS01 n=1 Tax=Anthostomella pinea TaxID=933095 RepID=A0AAI8YQP3_9PEZI|nr:Uu.00g018490.m01.CDS01 [Anthostomella pinea]
MLATQAFALMAALSSATQEIFGDTIHALRNNIQFSFTNARGITRTYPEAYSNGNRAGGVELDPTPCAGRALFEFPILANGAQYTGGNPGAHRVVVAQSPTSQTAYDHCFLMTHQGVQDRNAFAKCNTYQIPVAQTFLLFSTDIPSQNLGFVDSRATTLDLTIAGKDYTIHQSPTILNRPGSTTGAVLWKITPLVAEWLASSDNLLWTSDALSSSSSVLELGCGISGLVGLVVAPSVARYTLTDQSYVARLVEKNLEENVAVANPNLSGQRRKGRPTAVQQKANLRFTPLDWQLDEVTPNLTGAVDVRSFDAVIACDCIYNDTLIEPLVQTCVDACKLRSRDEGAGKGPAICIVAQQLRDPEIFEGWIKEFNKHFRAWRVPEEALSKDLRSNPGFVVHIGVLRDTI